MGGTLAHRQPFGRALLVLASIGLFGFAVFHAYHALVDPEGRARGVRAAKRIGWAVIAAVHVGLGIFAVMLASGDTQGREPDQTKSATAELLSWTPLGPWLVAGVGLTLLGVAAHQVWCAWRSKLDEQLDLSSLSRGARDRVVRLSRIGIAARGVVGGIAGAFLIVAALRADPAEAKGFAASLAAVREAPFGGVLFALVALGLIAFAGYELIEARYRRIVS